VLSETDYDGGTKMASIRRLSVPFSGDGAEVSHIVSLLRFRPPQGAAPVIVSDEDGRPTERRIAGRGSTP
jgi:hypothetical protein